jgi:hypothetical protein
MAFCTGCGAQIEDNAGFCTKCGTKTGVAGQAVSAGGAAAAPAMQPATKSNNTVLKVVLVIVGIFVLFGVLAIAGVFYVGYKAANSVKVDGNSATIETPFGKLASTDDPVAVAKQLDVDLYPGAKSTETSGVVTIGKMTTGAMTLQTSDSVQDVMNFYKSKYPNAQIITSGSAHGVMMVGDKNNLLTISVDGSTGTTTIQISRTTGVDMPIPGSIDNG